MLPPMSSDLVKVGVVEDALKVNRSEFCGNWSSASPIFLGAATNFYLCIPHLLPDLAVIWRMISAYNGVR